MSQQICIFFDHCIHSSFGLLFVQIDVLKEELDAAKEANERAPSKTMKSLVERLRNQLALKDKQQKVKQPQLW